MANSNLTVTRLRLSQETLEGIGSIYETASVAFRSLTVKWWIRIEPTPYGVEIVLQLRGERQAMKIRFSEECLSDRQLAARYIADVVRRMHEGSITAAEDNAPDHEREAIRDTPKPGEGGKGRRRG